MGLRKILSEWQNNSAPWENYSSYDYGEARTEKKEAQAEAFKTLGEQFGKNLKSSSERKWDAAMALREIIKRGLYRAYAEKFAEQCEEWIGGIHLSSNPSVLIGWAKHEWGVCKSSLYAMIDVLDTFAPTGHISAEAGYFRFGQLVEMTCLTYEQRKAIQPNWTIQQIREYKRSLKKATNAADDEQDTAEEDENFQTSGKYARFAKMKKDELCELILVHEDREKRMLATIDRLKAENERLKGSTKPTQAQDLTDADLDDLDE